MQIFEEILFCKAMYNTKTIHLSFSSWILAEGREHETDLFVVGGRGQSHALFLLQESSWQKISELFVFLLCVALKYRIFSKIYAFCLVLSN